MLAKYVNSARGVSNKLIVDLDAADLGDLDSIMLVQVAQTMGESRPYTPAGIKIIYLNETSTPDYNSSKLMILHSVYISSTSSFLSRSSCMYSPVTSRSLPVWYPLVPRRK